MVKKEKEGKWGSLVYQDYKEKEYLNLIEILLKILLDIINKYWRDFPEMMDELEEMVLKEKGGRLA